MAIKTIEYVVDITGVTPATEQFGGVQGDHRVTKLKFNLSENLYDEITHATTNKVMFRFDIYDGTGGIWQSNPQELSGSEVEIEFEERHTRYGGRLTVCLVLTAISEDNETELELYSFPAAIRLKNLPDGVYQEGENYESVTGLVEMAKSKADDAAQSAEAAANALENYVKKVSDPSDYLKVYTSGNDGNTVMRDIEETDAMEFNVGDIVVRNIWGNLGTGEPIDATDCANAAYVNNAISDSVDQTYDAESENAQSGIAVAKALQGYVEKANSNAMTDQAYIVGPLGENKTIQIEDTWMFEVGSYNFPSCIPRRNTNGNLMTNTPTQDLDCVNKNYLDARLYDINENFKIYYTKAETDTLVGDIETLLGGI